MVGIIITACAMGNSSRRGPGKLAREPCHCSEALASLEMEYTDGLQEPQE